MRKATTSAILSACIEHRAPQLQNVKRRRGASGASVGGHRPENQTVKSVNTVTAQLYSPFDLQLLFPQVKPERLTAEHADVLTRPRTFTLAPRVGIRELCDSTVTSPVPSSTLYRRNGTSGTPHDVVTTPSMSTE